MSSEDTLGFIRTLRHAADVKRFHTVRVNRSQTVGAHSYNAIMLAYVIAYHPMSTRDVDVHSVVKALVMHDVPEYRMGDVPGNIKHLLPEIGKHEQEWMRNIMPPKFKERMILPEDLEPMEYTLYKLCDRLELMLHCIEEVRGGNFDADISVIKNVVVGWLQDSQEEWQPLFPIVSSILARAEADL